MDELGDEGTAVRRARSGAWGLLQEAPVEFPPTFKFELDSDVFAKSSMPAWCDRIYWWARPSQLVATPKPGSYRRIGKAQFSDHRPVALSLDLRSAARGAVGDGCAEEPSKQPPVVRRGKSASCRQQ